jgi:glutathione S-transferase
MATCFATMGAWSKSVAACRTVVDVWFEATVASALGERLGEGVKRTQASTPLESELPMTRTRVLEGVDALLGARETLLARGDGLLGDDLRAADASLAAGLALLRLVMGGDVARRERATELADRALSEYPADEVQRVGLAEQALAMAAMIDGP